MTSLKIAVDQDVLSKLARYDLWPQTLASFKTLPAELGYLDTAPWVFALSNPVKRIKKLGSEASAQRLIQLLASATPLQVDQEVSELAAVIAREAQQGIGLQIDNGEAILFAACAVQQIPILFTGDKRSLKSLVQLPNLAHVAASMAGQVWCLEQIVLRLMNELGSGAMSAAIATDPVADKSLGFIFSAGAATTEANAREGLTSYISDLRGATGDLLVSS